jgi:hypothetical protein
MSWNCLFLEYLGGPLDSQFTYFVEWGDSLDIRYPIDIPFGHGGDGFYVTN